MRAGHTCRPTLSPLPTAPSHPSILVHTAAPPPPPQRRSTLTHPSVAPPSALPHASTAPPESTPTHPSVAPPPVPPHAHLLYLCLLPPVPFTWPRLLDVVVSAFLLPLSGARAGQRLPGGAAARDLAPSSGPPRWRGGGPARSGAGLPLISYVM